MIIETNTIEEFTKICPNLDTVGELIDGRFAVIQQMHFDLTEYHGCANGRESYYIVQVFNAPECYNLSYANDEQHMKEFQRAFVCDTLEEANDKFVSLIAERLAEFA